MEMKLKLESALKDAMRDRDEVRRRTIRGALAAVKNAEIDKGAALDDAAVAGILLKEIKSRRESILDAQKANREDLVHAAEAEIGVLEGFLPKMMSDEELGAQVDMVIAEVGATGPTDMGKVMKLLLTRLQGRAPSDRASQMVRQRLQS